MSDVLSDALLDLAERASGTLRNSAAEYIGLAAELLRPAEELELMTPDGRRYTGVAVMHEGVVLALLAAEARPRRRAYHGGNYAPDWDEVFYQE